MPAVAGQRSRQPADPKAGICRLWEVGFNIQQRRAVDDIDAFDVQGGALDAAQPNDREADGIRTSRRTRGEYPAQRHIHRRDHPQSKTTGPMQVRQQDDVRKPLKIPQPLSEGRIHLDTGLDPLGPAGLAGRLSRRLKRRADHADRGVANERALPGFPDRSGHRERCTGYDARARFCCSSR